LDFAVRSDDAVWVDVLTTQEVVAVGLKTILETATSPFPITTSGAEGAEPDVVLYDVIKLHVEDGADLDYWLKDTASTVIAVVRTLRPDLGARAMGKGVEWAIDLGITADELVRVIQDAIAGNLDQSPQVQESAPGAYPGVSAGLTRRESDVLGLVAQGLRNQEIAAREFLSINSVKTYIRTGYRKIGARTRGEAVVWAIHHGFPAGPSLGGQAPDAQEPEH
jgi:DNA-binding NarL/FixJ family response regulator